MTENLAASIPQRLLNLARSDDQPLNELLQYFLKVGRRERLRVFGNGRQKVQEVTIIKKLVREISTFVYS